MLKREARELIGILERVAHEDYYLLASSPSSCAARGFMLGWERVREEAEPLGLTPVLAQVEEHDQKMRSSGYYELVQNAHAFQKAYNWLGGELNASVERNRRRGPGVGLLLSYLREQLTTIKLIELQRSEVSQLLGEHLRLLFSSINDLKLRKDLALSRARELRDRAFTGGFTFQLFEEYLEELEPYKLSVDISPEYAHATLNEIEDQVRVHLLLEEL